VTATSTFLFNVTYRETEGIGKLYYCHIFL